MKKSTSRILITSISLVIAMSALYFVFPEDISAQQEDNVFVTHSGGVIKTTGEIIDPVYSTLLDPEYTESTVEFDPMEYLREFNYGKVSQLPDGTTLREFTIIAEDDQIMEVSPGVFFNVWTFNGTVPGPTIRATEGDIVRINFINNGSKPHTMHFHGIHPAEMDGVFEIVGQGGGRFTYEFEAGPAGVHPYHCHVMPVEEHIVRGMYGVYIVDPKEGRPAADEMVMVLNGFDTDFDTENNTYAANSIPFFYQNNPIQINTNELIRIYVVNMVEFDPINNLHLHANLFDYYPTGTSLVPSFYTDMITLSQTERGIMEFEYEYPGKYLFHAHKIEFSEKGWVGIFQVNDNPDQKSQTEIDYGT
ncbi:MAG: multicopper oxidase domain-containing protein [Thaumarchaeota archaeon]|nr:multicopper oxidase domain-containing protein [Nitrososphaerota archaeon]